MPQNRYRLRFVFWLDMLRPDELKLADKIELLKNERLFAKTIRDGIRLVVDLREGRVDVLRELFPWVLEQQVTANQNGGPQAMNVPQIAAPPDDDDEFDLVVTRDTTTESAATFLSTLDRLVTGQNGNGGHE